MSTIADYSVFTKAFLASGMTDFSKLYGKLDQAGNWSETEGSFTAFAVIPFNLDTPLTPREAMNFDRSKLVLNSASMVRRVSCRDANGEFIGNIVRVQPSQRDGSIRFVAKVAVPGFVSSESDKNPADTPYNTFVLVRTDASTNMDLPIAVATISKGYNLHKHKVVVTNVDDQFGVNFDDPLDDVENANYVSFTINNLNGYTSVDFNPDAYATYDDVANALSRGIDGLHIAFDTASGDLKLLDKDGNVLDQANLPIKADVIIADGEEGYKYVKTDVKQDIHAAKAWMPEGSTAWDSVPAANYEMQHAALVVGNVSTPASRVFVSKKPEFTAQISTESVQFDHVVIGDSTYVVNDEGGSRCQLLKVKVKGEDAVPTEPIYAGLSDGKVTHEGTQYDINNKAVEVDVIKYEDVTYVLLVTSSHEFQARTPDGEILGVGTIETHEGSSTGGVVGITLDENSMYTFEEGATTPSEFKDISGGGVTWFGTKDIPKEGYTLKYGLEAFVWTVKDAEAGKKISDPFFNQLNASLLALGFHEGDDIALGTNLAKLSTDLNGVDADEYIHGKDNKAIREREVDEQRANAKEELVAWNAQHPALVEERSRGTIIDSSGLDVRDGRITLGCGRVGEAVGEGASTFQKVNYGIQMKDHSSDPIQGRSESLDFTISHFTGGKVTFDDNGHATQLIRSTLLSIEAGSYISGAPTCLILAKVTRRPEGDSPNPDEGSPNPPVGSPVLTPVRMTAGFSVGQSYDASNGLNLTLHDLRENIADVLVGPDNHPLKTAPSIIEVQAIYTHPAAKHETVPAQQMHTYIGEWVLEGHPHCSFLCNKIEEWMTAIDLTDTDPSPDFFNGVGLYVVIRVY